MTAPNARPAMVGPGGCLGSFAGTEGYQATAPSGLWDKGAAEQGTGSLCFPALPALPLLSRVPIGVPTATTMAGGCRRGSCATTGQEASQEAGAQRPEHFCHGGL